MALVRVTALLLCFCSITSVAKAEIITEKYECIRDQGCRPHPRPDYRFQYHIDYGTKTYTRCSSSAARHFKDPSCSEWSAQFSITGGGSIAIDVPGKGLTALSSLNAEFTETSNAGELVYVSFGTCK